MTRTARPVTYRTTAVRTPDSVTLSYRRSPQELLRAVVARLLGRKPQRGAGRPRRATALDSVITVLRPL